MKLGETQSKSKSKSNSRADMNHGHEQQDYYYYYRYHHHEHEHAHGQGGDLNDLALGMRHSGWQLEELVRISERRLYKFGRKLFLCVEKICNCNLYAYIDTARLEKESTTANDDVQIDGIITITIPEQQHKRNKHHYRVGRVGNNFVHCVGSSLSTNAQQQQHQQHHSTMLPGVDRLLLLNELKFGRKRRTTSWCTILSRLLFAFTLWSILHLSVSVYYQYNYDFYHYHLAQYRKAVLVTGPAAKVATADTRDDDVMIEAERVVGMYARGNLSERMLVELEAQARARLLRVGSFLMEQAWFCECCYVLMMILCAVIYVSPILHHHFLRPYDFYYIRMLIDWDQEQMNCNYLIQRVCQSVAKSSEIFTRIAIEHLRNNHDSLVSDESDTDDDDDNDDDDDCDHGHDHEMARRRRPPGRLRVRENRLRSITATLDSSSSSSTCTSDNKNNNNNHMSDEKDMDWLYVSEHRWLVMKLRQMALGGQLQPMDRCDLERFLSSLRAQLVLLLSVCLGCFQWNICLFTMMPRVFNFTYETSATSILTMLYLATQNILLTIGGAFYASNCLVHCMNQVASIEQMCQMIGEFLTVNELVLRGRELELERNRNRNRKSKKQVLGLSLSGAARVSSSSSLSSMRMKVMMLDMVVAMEARQAEHEQHLTSSRERVTCETPINDYDLVNGRLLLLLMRYKISVAQLRPTRITFSYLFLGSSILMIVFPLLARLHAPYLTNNNSKWLIILVCIIMIGVPSLGALPIPWSNARSSKLYTRMVGLIARLAEGERRLGRVAQERNFYNKRLLWLLRKELDCSENFKRQLTIRALGIEITYKEMLKIYFWLGLLIITFTVDFQVVSISSSQLANGDTNAPITNWLADPLGLTKSFDI